MAVNFDKIVKYTINSVCESNLHIGSSVGGKEEVLVHPVTGVPFIQASSIAGVFRRNYEKLYNDSDKLFGARSMNANSNASEFESRVKFTDGIFDNNPDAFIETMSTLADYRKKSGHDPENAQGIQQKPQADSQKDRKRAEKRYGGASTRTWNEHSGPVLL